MGFVLGGSSRGCLNIIVLVPLYELSARPWHSRAISFALPSNHFCASLPWIRWRYSSSLPVVVLRTAFATKSVA